MERPVSMILGYIRVSSKEQHLDRQIQKMLELGVDDRFLFIDTASGKTTDRPEYQMLKRALREGDTLYIHELDRLGRNKRQILEELQFFKDQHITLRILDVPTTLIDYAAYGESAAIIFDMVNSILIEVLSTMAEQELKRLHKRQREGIAAAHAKGVKFGRPQIPYPPNWEEIYQDWKSNKIKAVEAMKLTGLTKSTFYKRVKEYEKRE